ncbi:hypothetical protein CDL15_Pgr024717 [Punica granatum]|uniref:Uncharacterized protein n=1 Tax=Punica granatum TaxID=22663 RepID=A0A218W6C4_PUNGR|nr:hypothetical protein CDL15_Pgr024717 [Punica granatum]
MKLGGGEESGGRERRFPSLGAAATVQEGAGGGGERRLGCAVLKTGVTRLRLVRIEGNFDFFAARGSERWRVGRACQWWHAVAVGGRPRCVEDDRGTSVKEGEKKRGGEEKRRKEWRGGKEEEEKKRGRSEFDSLESFATTSDQTHSEWHPQPQPRTSAYRLSARAAADSQADPTANRQARKFLKPIYYQGVI